MRTTVNPHHIVTIGKSLRDVMVNVVGNRYGDPRSNPG